MAKQMPVRIGINGFGRIGRLALRALWDHAEVEVVQINEIAGDAATASHLLNFDSVQGRWHHDAVADADGDGIVADGRRIGFSSHAAPGDVPWDDLGIEVVLESTSKFKTPETIAPFFERGVDSVVVAAPVKQGALNVVIGVNDDLYDPNEHKIVTAASCTTNCLAPVVKVIHEGIGIIPP